MGFPFLRAYFRSAVRRASTSLPSRACFAHVRDVSESAPQGLLLPLGWTVSRETIFPLEVLGLVAHSLVRNVNGPGLSFRLGRDAASLPFSALLFGPPPPPALQPLECLVLLLPVTAFIRLRISTPEPIRHFYLLEAFVSGRPFARPQQI
jgi:hypothetical protein